MTLTLLVLASFSAMLLICMVLYGLFLAKGLRWAKADNITSHRILLTIVVSTLLQFGWSAVLSLGPWSKTPDLALELVGLLGSLAISILTITVIFKTRLGQAFQAFLMTLVPVIILVPFLLLVWRPLFYEAFASPTNAMAPTLLGNHVRGKCSVCGEPNHGSHYDVFPLRMICGNFHVDSVSSPDKLTADEEAGAPTPKLFIGDRFLVAKFLEPHRWDLVTFQYPGNPESLYVMRLVGMPGETIHIANGAVWADGVKLETPSSLDGIQYLTSVPDWHEPTSGAEDQPAKLKDDEYFVLGDFSAQSMDSRLWQKGAEGRSPFAVPADHLQGIVTHIYWPPSRWRAFR